MKQLPDSLTTALQIYNSQTEEEEMAEHTRVYRRVTAAIYEENIGVCANVLGTVFVELVLAIEDEAEEDELMAALVTKLPARLKELRATK